MDRQFFLHHPMPEKICENYYSLSSQLLHIMIHKFFVIINFLTAMVMKINITSPVLIHLFKIIFGFGSLICLYSILIYLWDILDGSSVPPSWLQSKLMIYYISISLDPVKSVDYFIVETAVINEFKF